MDGRSQFISFLLSPSLVLYLYLYLLAYLLACCYCCLAVVGFRVTFFWLGGRDLGGVFCSCLFKESGRSCAIYV